jgi:hypothetical protein
MGSLATAEKRRPNSKTTGLSFGLGRNLESVKQPIRLRVGPGSRRSWWDAARQYTIFRGKASRCRL